MIPFEPSKIPMPFAYEGGRNEILESGGEVSGEASYSQGFPAITSTPLSQGGIPPRRKDFNGILYILSAYAYLYQSGGTPSYSDEVDYIAGCIVYYSNQFYVCVKQNGSGTTAGLKTPGSDSSYWKTLWDYLMGDISNAGSGINPIYLSGGKFIASTSTVGSSTRPVYLNSGTITQTGSTLDVSVTGSAESLGSKTVGSATKGIYLNSGVPTAMSGTVGSGTNPVYLSSGTITKSGSTVGSGTKPVYLSSGTVTASGSTVGSGTKPVYLNAGTVTASSSTVGGETTPVYLKSGVITACGSSLFDLRNPTLTPLINWSKTTSHGYSSALGMNHIDDGNITLTDSFLNYDALVVLGGSDSREHVSFCIWYKWQLKVAAYAGTSFMIWHSSSAHWTVSCLNRSSNPSSETYLVDRDENCVIFEIYGATFG